MDKYLRLAIKFHGYCIAIVSIILTLYFTSRFTSIDKQALIWFDLRSTKGPAIVFGILWLVANVFLFAALICEKKWLVLPFCVMFAIDALLCTASYIYEITYNPWAWMIIISPVIPLFIMVVLYVILSMLTLIRLFELEPNRSSESEPALVLFEQDSCNQKNA